MTQAIIQEIERRDPQYAKALRNGKMPNYVIPEPTPHPPLRYFAYAVLDAAVLASIELGPFPSTGVIRLACPWTEARTLSEGGVAFLKLEPQDSTDDAIDPTRALNEALVDDAGFDVEPLETSDRWLAEAERFSIPSVAAAPVDPFEELTGRRATYLAGVGARLYWSFCLPIETVTRLIGVAFTPGRSLWPARYDADKLAEAQRVREEAEKVEEDKRAAKKAEIERLKTIEEVGAQVVAVPKDRPHSGDGPAPWKEAALLWSTDTELFYGFRKLRGLDLPELGGELRVLSASDLVPSHCAPVPDANASALGFARYARQHAGSPGRGPIEQWSTEGLARARELAVVFAPTFLHGAKAYLWGHCTECLVRGLLVFPTMAESLIRAAIRAEEIRRSPPIKVPSQFAERERAIEGRDFADPSSAVREIQMIDVSKPAPIDGTIAGLCIAAAKSGSVSAGCLLAAPPTFPTTPKPSKKAGH